MLSVGGAHENRRLSMKTAASIFVLGISLSSLLAAQSPKPLKTIDLNRVKIAAPERDSKWQGYSKVFWLDDQHFAAFLSAATCSGAVAPCAAAHPQPSVEVAVFDSAGAAQTAARRDGLISVARGPRGTIAGFSWGKIELLDTQLHLKQSLDCPNESKSCGITLAPSSAFNSEFAVCSNANAQQVCEFYRGWPAEKVSSGTTAVSAAENPYTHAADVGNASWQVGDGETWSFNNGLLTRAGVGRASSPVSSEDFVGKNGGNCEGQLSASEPRRFLAVCTGAHWYSDGMFDAIFGFSSVVLFDVPSGHQVMRIDGPAFTSAALSPSGKKVATLRGSKVRLYEVD
jgi:hypothetical protein